MKHLLLVCARLLPAGCDGRNAAELTAAAKEQVEANDLDAAVIQLKNALQQDPNAAEARLWLGKALLPLNPW